MLATQAAKVHITLFPSSSVYFQQTLMTFPDFQALNFLIFIENLTAAMKALMLLRLLLLLSMRFDCSSHQKAIIAEMQ